MWIFTPIGFYSVVYKPDEAKKFAGDEKLLTVRGRTREDLEALQQYINGVVIHEVDHSDYRFRTYVNRDDFAVFMSIMIMSMSYSNFKDEVMMEQGPERATVYHEVWAAAARLQGNGPEVDDRQMYLDFGDDYEVIDINHAPTESDFDFDWAQFSRDFTSWQEGKNE